MDSKLYSTLTEAYAAVYDRDLNEDLFEQYEFVDELSDEELTDVVEEVIDDLLEEGYDFEDVEDLLKEELIGEILSEARVDMASRAARRKAEMAASEKSAKAARKTGAAVVSKEKRAERVARVKGAVKSGVSRAKSAVKSGAAKAKSTARKAVDEPARKYAEKRGVVKSKSGKTTLGGGSGIGSVKFKQRTPEGRREVRKAVAKDIAGRASAKAKEVKGKAVQKASSAAVKGYAAGRAAKQAVGDAAGRAKQSAKNMAARAGRSAGEAKAKAKSGVKGFIRKAAEKVASGASKVAKRMSEEYDQYDLVLEFLVDHEIAEDLQEAQWMMVNEVDSEDIATILEAYELEEGKSDRPLGVMHQFARGVKQKRGEKREEKYGVDSEGNRVGKYVKGGSRSIYK